MKDHIAYLRYVLRHKIHVLQACRKTGCPLWRGLLHDLSKFSSPEWSPYVHTFYAPDGSKRYAETEEFNRAWLHHQHCNPHHWQYWCLRMDRGDVAPLRMPEVLVREMVADWIGAGLAQGKPNTLAWYESNRDRMVLHEDTRAIVERLLTEATKPC